MPIEICDSSQLANLAAERIAAAMIATIAREGGVSLALAGGNTPRAAYEALAKIPGMDWARVSVYFGDERAVPPTDSDSNYRMAEAALFRHVPLLPENIHRIQGEDADHDAAARAYEAVLPERISIMILGIGEDGHTASLFPRSPALNERARRVLPVIGPKPPPQRLTLTPPVIEAAGLLVMLAVGAGKANAVARALRGPMDVTNTPSCLARSGLWLLDQDAAAQLSS